MANPDCIDCWDKIAKNKVVIKPEEQMILCLDCKKTSIPGEVPNIPETQELIY